MVTSFNKINNITISHLKSFNTKYADENPGLDLGQAQQCSLFKPIVWISQCTSMYSTFLVL